MLLTLPNVRRCGFLQLWQRHNGTPRLWTLLLRLWQPRTEVVAAREATIVRASCMYHCGQIIRRLVKREAATVVVQIMVNN